MTPTFLRSLRKKTLLILTLKNSFNSSVSRYDQVSQCFYRVLIKCFERNYSAASLLLICEGSLVLTTYWI